MAVWPWGLWKWQSYLDGQGSHGRGLQDEMGEGQGKDSSWSLSLGEGSRAMTGTAPALLATPSFL